KVSPLPPLTLGSDLSGVVEEIGPGVGNFKKGDQIYGVTNAQFCGAQAEYAVVSGKMVAAMPQRLSHIEAASVPVEVVTAWQMLFEYGGCEAKSDSNDSGSWRERRRICGSACGALKTTRDRDRPL